MSESENATERATTDMMTIPPAERQTPPSCIGGLAHPQRPATSPVAERISHSLRERGIETWLYTEWDEDDVRKDIARADMVVAIGGDGAMLKAARSCAPTGVPVLGLNMGRLGFLTEIASPDSWEDVLDRVLNGEFWIETRMMITATLRREGETILEGTALNEIVISGDSIGHMIQLDTYIDRHWTTTYSTDALIIATPTGSTAYALAVGGPILPPDLANILIVPTAPFMSMDRPIVLSEGSTVAVQVSPENRHGVILMADAVRLGNVTLGDTVHIRVSDDSSRFVRIRPRGYFYRSLLDKLEPRVNAGAKRAMLLLED